MKIKVKNFLNIIVFILLGILIRVLEYYKVFNQFFVSSKSEAVFTIIMIAVGNGIIVGGVIAILVGIIMLLVKYFKK